jgi:hypothetical protein
VALAPQVRGSSTAVGAPRVWGGSAVVGGFLGFGGGTSFRRLAVVGSSWEAAQQLEGCTAAGSYDSLTQRGCGFFIFLFYFILFVQTLTFLIPNDLPLKYSKCFGTRLN